MARVLKPTALKVVAGTTRPDRAIVAGAEYPALTDVPAPPRWLANAHAVREWNKLAPMLTANKLLTEGGVASLGLLCSLFGRIVEGFADGGTPAISVVNAYRFLVSEFGLTPASQGRVRPFSADEPANKFSGNGKRTA